MTLAPFQRQLFMALLPLGALPLLWFAIPHPAAFLVVALVAVFVYWRKDTKRFLQDNEAHRDALASVVKDFNERLDQKDKQVMDLALEMKDAMNAIAEKGKDV